MELKPGMSALVTGGASGIASLRFISDLSLELGGLAGMLGRCVSQSEHGGKALCIAFAQKCLFMIIVDFSEDNGREVASLV
ncbi:hypothetical protein ABZP36_035611 [Zizania latifolia]